MASDSQSNRPHHSPRPTRTIEIKLEVPQFEKIEKVSAKSAALARIAWSKRHWRVIMAAGLAITAAIITISVLSQQRPTEVTGKKLTTVSEADRKAQVPQFDAILPSGKTIESLGGWTRVSPVDRNAVFAYTDVIRDNRIVISQQPLPEEFIEDTEGQVEALAQNDKATEKVTIGGQTIYIKTSAKGPQSIIFTKKNLLVLITSSVKLSNDDWIGYVNSLQ